MPAPRRGQPAAAMQDLIDLLPDRITRIIEDVVAEHVGRRQIDSLTRAITERAPDAEDRHVPSTEATDGAIRTALAMALYDIAPQIARQELGRARAAETGPGFSYTNLKINSALLLGFTGSAAVDSRLKLRTKDGRDEVTAAAERFDAEVAEAERQAEGPP